MKTAVASWIANNPQGPDLEPDGPAGAAIHIGCGWCKQRNFVHHEDNCPWIAAVHQLDDNKVGP